MLWWDPERLFKISKLNPSGYRQDVRRKDLLFLWVNSANNDTFSHFVIMNFAMFQILDYKMGLCADNPTFYLIVWYRKRDYNRKNRRK